MNINHNTPRIKCSIDYIKNSALTSSQIIDAAICKYFPGRGGMKMELLMEHILGLLKQSSTFAENCRIKLMPNGVGFFCFLTC
jgi:hypothetical protein